MRRRCVGSASAMHLGDVAGHDGRPSCSARARRCRRHEPSAPTTSSGGGSASASERELVVGHRLGHLGQLEREQAAEAAAAGVGRPRHPLAAGGVEQALRLVVLVQLAEHVARVVVRHAVGRGGAAASGRRRRGTPSARGCGRRGPGPVARRRGRRRARTARARRPSPSWRTTRRAPRRRRRRRASRASSVVRATFAASSWKPEFHAGWPQHVCPLGHDTVQPPARSTRTVATPTSGSNRSTTQVTNSVTRIAATLRLLGGRYWPRHDEPPPTTSSAASSPARSRPTSCSTTTWWSPSSTSGRCSPATCSSCPAATS